MDENEVATPAEAEALPDAQWVQDADGANWCIINTHMGFPQRMAMRGRSLTNLDNLKYPLHLGDFMGDCEHKWGHHELGHCMRCGQIIAEPRPVTFDGGTMATFRAFAKANAEQVASR